jgi:Protein of unknown function (DUF1501)
MTLDSLLQIQTRRRFLQQSTCGLGTAALWHLLSLDGLTQSDRAARSSLGTVPIHFPARAKNVIFLFMAGGPSQLDLFDPKPEMRKWDGRPLPDSMTRNLELAFIRPTAKIWATSREFKRYGGSGLEFSDFLPNLATCADDICMVRSMTTDQINHHTGQLMMSCGSPLMGRPSLGSWVTYGLGSESRSLPGFVVLSSGKGADAGSGIWSSGFLPSSHQGVPFRSSGDPVLHLSNPPGISQEAQRVRIDALRDLNQIHYRKTADEEIVSRIASYELAFQMQLATPELLDLSKESTATLEMYGTHKDSTRPFATNCLLARRLIERGVRFVQVVQSGWDNHTSLMKDLEKNCRLVDQPTAALLRDLKQRGLLDTTLVIWGGEFGRTPMVENRTPKEEASQGRDHHRLAFTMWMAGGGFKGGQVVGQTDELGFRVVQDQTSVHDLHATILYCLGFDHKRLTYRHQGRDFRLTDVEGNVVQKLLA